MEHHTQTHNEQNLKLFKTMNGEKALVNLDTILKQQGLTDIQEVVFRKAWEGQSYPEIAESAGYEANYIKDVGSKLWKLLSKALSEQVTKSNFRSVLRRHNARLHQKRLAQDIIAADSVSQREDWGEAVAVPVFYGRLEELATGECRLKSM